MEIKNPYAPDTVGFYRFDRNSNLDIPLKQNKENEKPPIDKDYLRFRRLLYTIFYICDLAGFKVENRIALVDKKTGKVWR